MPYGCLYMCLAIPAASDDSEEMMPTRCPLAGQFEKVDIRILRFTLANICLDCGLDQHKTFSCRNLDRFAAIEVSFTNLRLVVRFTDILSTTPYQV